MSEYEKYDATEIQFTPKVCFTGFCSLRKEELGKLAIKNGCTTHRTVTKKLDILVTGGNAGLAKMARAEAQANTKKMDEKEFLTFVKSRESRFG